MIEHPHNKKRIFEKDMLYVQFKQAILEYIVAKRWSPGSMLPSEFDLASEFNVSQSTVRKALNILTDENVLTRKQGKGTFVSQSGELRFFKFKTDGGSTDILESRRLSLEKMPTPNFVKQHFGADNTECFKLERLRKMADGCMLYEVLYMPYEIFPTLEKEPSLNRFLYQYYEKTYNILVNGAINRLRAVGANAGCEKFLGVVQGTPVLLQEHIVHTLTAQVIEYRQAYCQTDNMSYEIRL